MNKEGTTYQNKLKYIAAYNKEKAVNFFIRFNAEKDADIISYLKAQPSKADYIRKLIKKDMNK